MTKIPSITSFAIKALVTSSLVLAQDKPPQDRPLKFTTNVMDYGTNGGLNGLSSTPYTVKQWPWGTVPPNCMDWLVTREAFCNPYDIEVYELKYADCPNQVPHLVCRCHDAQMTLDQFAVQFGRMSVKGREAVRDVTISRSQDGRCYAKAPVPDLFFHGPCNAEHSLILHETTHIIDWLYLRVNNWWYSESEDWKLKVHQGSCMSDSYGRGSWIESFAQVGVMAAYHANVQSIWNLDVGCMADQVGRAIELLDGYFRRNAGAQCSRAHGKLTPICMGPGARDSGNCPNVQGRDVAENEVLDALDSFNMTAVQTCSLWE